MSHALDPRRHPFRPDLAAEVLRGRVDAPRYAAGVPATVLRAAVPLRKVPDAKAGFTTEALFGEAVTIYDTADGWAWLQLARDRYVGYVPADTLAADIPTPTHRVKATGTFVYGTPEIKSPPILHLSLNASFAVDESNERFYRLATGGYVFARHVAEIGWHGRDFVEVAERFLGTPYLWGGKTRIGLDCSGLVQVSLQACGIEAPRDSDMQRSELGSEIAIPTIGETHDLEGLQRGDLVFWPGHVGIMSDGVMLLHANAHHMAVAIEPLPEAASRIKSASGSDIAVIRRLPALSRVV
jgi:cell wall-associated NlpC family hydrolase